jgi:hypothetical protein
MSNRRDVEDAEVFRGKERENRVAGLVFFKKSSRIFRWLIPPPDQLERGEAKRRAICWAGVQKATLGITERATDHA